jgi:hypothetical protein
MFGSKGEKTAQDVAVSAEIGRLISLPVADLAAEMMPAFGPGGPRVPGGGVGILQILSWLMSSYPRGNKNLSRLLPVGREGIQALERAGLVQILQRAEDGAAECPTCAPCRTRPPAHEGFGVAGEPLRAVPSSPPRTWVITYSGGQWHDRIAIGSASAGPKASTFPLSV